MLRLHELAPDDLPVESVITSITLAELSVGPLVTTDETERAARLAQVQRAETDYGDSLPFDAEAARTFAQVAAHIRRRLTAGQPRQITASATVRSPHAAARVCAADLPESAQRAGKSPCVAHTGSVTSSPARRRHLASSPFQPGPKPTIEQFECGDRVCHDSYGMGRVVGRETEAVTVDFRTQTVRVTSPFSKMTKL